MIPEAGSRLKLVEWGEEFGRKMRTERKDGKDRHKHAATSTSVGFLMFLSFLSGH